MTVRRIAYAVLAMIVIAGIWIGAGGDTRMRWFTAAVFGPCALAIARKLWRGEAGGRFAAPRPAPDADVAADPPVPDGAETAPSGPWRVYGHDTFAREDYFIGEFHTEEEARAAVRQTAESLARFQDESLRDEIWVEPPDSKFRMRV